MGLNKKGKQGDRPPAKFKSHFWMAYEAVTAAVMLAALVLLFVYVVLLSSRARLGSG